MAPILSFPVGVRFHPTDEELTTHYLKIKVTGRPLPSGWETMMVERDIYGEEATPWKLFNDNDPWHIPVGPSGSLLSKERVIYVYTKLSKVGKTGNKNNTRTAGCGHWRGNSTADCTTKDGEVIGKKRSFTFKSEEKNVESWTMDEYSLDGVGCEDQDNNKYVLCKIKRKAGRPDSGTNVQEKAVQDSLGKRRIVPEKGNQCAATKKLRSDPPHTDAFMMDPELEYRKQECISSADAAPANIPLKAAGPLVVGEYAYENPNLDESVMNLGGEQTYESSAYAAAASISRIPGTEYAYEDPYLNEPVVNSEGEQTYGSSGTGPTQDNETNLPGVMDEANMNASDSYNVWEDGYRWKL